MKTREKFHKLIDEIQDEQTLKAYMDLIQMLQKNKGGDLWNSLTKEQQAELLTSHEESLEEENLIDHEQVKEEHTKWLKR